MNLVVGVGLLSATLIIYCWAFEQHRRPVPAAWSRNAGLSTSICLLLVTLLAAGLCFFAAGLISPVETFGGMSAVTWAVLAAEVVAAALIVPAMVRMARRAAAASAAEVVPFPPRGPAESTGAGKRKLAA